MKLYTWEELTNEINKKYGSEFIGRNDNILYHNGTRVVIENDAEDTIVYQGERFNCEPGWSWVSGKSVVNDKINIDVFYAAFQYVNSNRTKVILNVIELDKELGV